MRNRLLRAKMNRRNLDPRARNNLNSLDHISLNNNIRSYNYAVIDLETTGLDFKNDEILSIGAIRVIDGRIQLGDIFNELVKSSIYIPPSSIKIHKIVPEMVSDALPIKEVFYNFLEYLGDNIIVAHNARFDMNFLNILMKKYYGFLLQNLVLDTMHMCRNIIFPPHHQYPYGIDLNSKQYGLDGITKYLGIDIYQRHTAIGDAFATAMVFQRVISRLEKLEQYQLKTLIKGSCS